jgi:hypothetical protein
LLVPIAALDWAIKFSRGYLALRPITCRKSVLKQENRKKRTALSNLTKPKKNLSSSLSMMY